MSIKMVPVSNDNNLFGKGHYKASEELAAPGNGTWVLVEPGINQVNIDLLVTAGEGYVEATNDYEGAKADSATGFKWDLGNVTADTQAAAVGVAAVRVVNVSGTTKMIVGGVA